MKLMGFKDKVDQIAAVMDVLHQVADVKDDDSKLYRYEALALAKAIEASAKKLIKKLDPEARKDAKAGERGENDKTSWTEHRLGDFVARQYEGKMGSPKVQSVDAVKDLIRSKPKIAMSQVIEKVEVVNLGALEALVATGHLTQEELDSVVVRKRGTGSFSLLVEGDSKRALDGSKW